MYNVVCELTIISDKDRFKMSTEKEVTATKFVNFGSINNDIVANKAYVAVTFNGEKFVTQEGLELDYFCYYALMEFESGKVYRGKIITDFELGINEVLEMEYQGSKVTIDKKMPLIRDRESGISTFYGKTEGGIRNKKFLYSSKRNARTVLYVRSNNPVDLTNVIDDMFDDNNLKFVDRQLIIRHSNYRQDGYVTEVSCNDISKFIYGLIDKRFNSNITQDFRDHIRYCGYTGNEFEMGEYKEDFIPEWAKWFFETESWKRKFEVDDYGYNYELGYDFKDYYINETNKMLQEAIDSYTGQKLKTFKEL